MRQYKTWLYYDVIQYLQYIDESIIFNADIVSKFKLLNVNGYNLSQINDLNH